MPKRLADVIEKYLYDHRGAVEDEHFRLLAEDLERHLQDSFVILPKDLEGKK